MNIIPGPHHTLETNTQKIEDFVLEATKQHKDTLDPNSPRDFIDCFLIKMEQVG